MSTKLIGSHNKPSPWFIWISILKGIQPTSA